MKVIVKLGDTEIIIEAQDAQEVKSLGQVVRDIVGEGVLESNPDSVEKPYKQRHTDSELNQARVSGIEWVLATNRVPMSAPEIAAEVKQLDHFQTRSGNPIHIVRRVLADAKFEKTLSGLFRLKQDSVAKNVEQEVVTNGNHRFYAPAGDDLDDPFADN